MGHSPSGHDSDSLGEGMIVANRWWGGFWGCSDQSWSNISGTWPVSREAPAGVLIRFPRKLPIGVAMETAGNQVGVEWGWGFGACGGDPGKLPPGSR